jgi:hypothetical protein
MLITQNFYLQILNDGINRVFHPICLPINEAFVVRSMIYFAPFTK